MTDQIRATILEFAASRKHGTFLMTTPSSGFPYLVQMGGIIDPDFTVRLRTRGGSLKVRQVQRNPRAAYLVVERTEGVQRNVLIQGNASVSDQPAVVEAFFRDLNSRFAMNLSAQSPRFAGSVIITISPVFLRAEGFTEPAPPGIYSARLGRSLG